jgi:hypothetical protein
MNKNYALKPQSIASWMFWRTAAYLAGVAVERRRLLMKTLTYSPFILAGAAAYIVGRVLGAMFLSGFSF